MLIRQNRQLSWSPAVALTRIRNRGYSPTRITREDSKDRPAGTVPDATAVSDPTLTMMLKFGVAHTNGTFEAEAEGAFGGVSGHSSFQRTSQAQS